MVKKHLLMSMVAQRKDISDPEVIYNFSKEMVSLKQLDYLYLLTMCDIRATNPKQWTTWKDNLLSELYHKAAAALKAGLDSPQQRSIVTEETRTSATRILTTQGIVTEVLQELWAQFSNDYFIYHSPDEIIWHTQILLDKKYKPPITRARINQRGEAEIFIYSEEQKKLFASIASTLEQLGLNIADEKINLTNKQYALHSFKVLEEDGSSPTGEFRMKEIVDKLNARLSDLSVEIPPSTRRQNRALKSFAVKTSIRFEQLVGKDITVVNIESADRPGLLASIAQAFVEYGVNIHHAKVSTAGEKAIDSFHITDKDHNPLLDDSSMGALKTILLKHINQ